MGRRVADALARSGCRCSRLPTIASGDRQHCCATLEPGQPERSRRRRDARTITQVRMLSGARTKSSGGGALYRSGVHRTRRRQRNGDFGGPRYREHPFESTNAGCALRRRSPRRSPAVRESHLDPTELSVPPLTTGGRHVRETAALDRRRIAPSPPSSISGAESATSKDPQP